MNEELQRCELSAILQSVAASFGSVASKSGVELHVGHVPPAQVPIPSARLAQVLSSIFSNAMAFTNRGDRVDVSCAMRDERVEITISDTGLGIDSALLARLFLRFATGGSRRSGLGLGLAVARDILEQHGGSIDAFSEGLYRGARFVIRLPVLAP